MDVIVTPASGPREVWTLTDRLGRKVGEVTCSAEGEFVITAADTRSNAPLAKISAVQPSLDAALDAVASCLKGICQFSSAEDK